MTNQNGNMRRGIDRAINPVDPNAHYTNSWSWMIQGVFLERLKIVPVFSTVVKFCRTTALPVQEEHLPRLGVYIMPDDSFEAMNGPLGNQGEPQFTWKTTLGFSYIVINNDPEITEDVLDRAYWAILQTLHDPAWHMWPGTEAIMIMGVSGGATRKVYGTGGRNNETPIGEMQMELTVSHRWIFEPVVNDVFEAMRHQTVLPGDPDPTDPQRPPIVAEWTLPQ